MELNYLYILRQRLTGCSDVVTSSRFHDDSHHHTIKYNSALLFLEGVDSPWTRSTRPSIPTLIVGSYQAMLALTWATPEIKVRPPSYLHIIFVFTHHLWVG